MWEILHAHLLPKIVYQLFSSCILWYILVKGPNCICTAECSWHNLHCTDTDHMKTNKPTLLIRALISWDFVSLCFKQRLSVMGHSWKSLQSLFKFCDLELLDLCHVAPAESEKKLKYFSWYISWPLYGIHTVM